MKARTLIVFSVPVEKKARYFQACSDLGVSVSAVCRSALENAIHLSERMKAAKSGEQQ